MEYKVPNDMMTEGEIVLKAEEVILHNKFQV